MKTEFSWRKHVTGGIFDRVVRLSGKRLIVLMESGAAHSVSRYPAIIYNFYDVGLLPRTKV